MGLHPSNKPATRYIDMRKHFCRQHVELGNVTTPFQKTVDMLGDFQVIRHLSRLMNVTVIILF